MELRDYQKEALDKIIEAMPNKKALAVLPVGSGKTVIISYVLKTLQVPSLVIVHTREILYQLQKTLQTIYPTVSIGCIGYGEESYGFITIACIQSLRSEKRLAKLQDKGIQVVCVDECHHAPASTYQRVLQTFEHAFHVGVTATPDRLDRESVVPIFGYPVYQISMVELIKQGYLVDIRAWRVETDISLDAVKIKTGEYNQGQLAKVCDRVDRNSIVVDAYSKYAHGKPAICFAVDIDHAKHLSEAFNRSGIQSAYITSKTHLTERESILMKFYEGSIQVLCNCEIFTEGFDVPKASCIILARPTMSRSLYCQMIGRGVRTFKNKKECTVLDITDNTDTHSLKPPSLKELGLKSGRIMTEAYYEIERTEKAIKALVNSLNSLVEVHVDLFEDERPVWSYDDETGVLKVSASRFKYELVPHKKVSVDAIDTTRYSVYLIRKNRIFLLYDSLTYSMSKRVILWFLSEIGRGNEKYCDPTLNWQKQPATIKQLNGLQMCGFSVENVKTKWHASLRYSLLSAKNIQFGDKEQTSC